MSGARRADHSLVFEFPLVARAGGKSDERWAPVAVDDDSHFEAQPVANTSGDIRVSLFLIWRVGACRVERFAASGVRSFARVCVMSESKEPRVNVQLWHSRRKPQKTNRCVKNFAWEFDG